MCLDSGSVGIIHLVNALLSQSRNSDNRELNIFVPWMATGNELFSFSTCLHTYTSITSFFKCMIIAAFSTT